MLVWFYCAYLAYIHLSEAFRKRAYWFDGDSNKYYNNGVALTHTIDDNKFFYEDDDNKIHFVEGNVDTLTDFVTEEGHLYDMDRFHTMNLGNGKTLYILHSQASLDGINWKSDDYFTGIGRKPKDGNEHYAIRLVTDNCTCYPLDHVIGLTSIYKPDVSNFVQFISETKDFRVFLHKGSSQRQKAQ